MREIDPRDCQHGHADTEQTEIDLLREQLRSSNEQLIAAQARIALLLRLMVTEEQEITWSELPRIAGMDNLTALASHDKEVRAKALEDAAIPLTGRVGDLLRAQAYNIRSSK